MKRCLCLFAVFLLFAAEMNVYGEDPEPVGMLPGQGMILGLRRRAIVLDIDTRVLEQEEVVWEETHNKLTLPNSPVNLKLVGSNIIIAVQFTPFIRRHGQNVLVAQGQIWIDVPNEGIRYHSSIQTIPLEFDEPIYFFPLGQSRQSITSEQGPGGQPQNSEDPRPDASIEITITVKPYIESGDSPAEETSDNTENAE